MFAILSCKRNQPKTNSLSKSCFNFHLAKGQGKHNAGCTLKEDLSSKEDQTEAGQVLPKKKNKKKKKKHYHRPALRFFAGRGAIARGKGISLASCLFSKVKDMEHTECRAKMSTSELSPLFSFVGWFPEIPVAQRLQHKDLPKETYEAKISTKLTSIRAKDGIKPDAVAASSSRVD